MNTDIIRDVRPLPDTKDELLRLISSIFDQYPERVMEITIRAGEPVIFGYRGEHTDTYKPINTAPYSLLRTGRIDEFKCDDHESPRSILFMMIQQLIFHGSHPVCVITHSSSIWDWLNVANERVREANNILGMAVYYDESLHDNSLIIAGSDNPALGTGGIDHGVKYGW